MLQPLNSLILVEWQEEEKKTESGLYIPPTSDNNAFGFLKEGKVLNVNPDCKHIEVGDIVLFNHLAKTEIPKDKTMVLVRTEDVYAVVKK